MLVKRKSITKKTFTAFLGSPEADLHELAKPPYKTLIHNI